MLHGLRQQCHLCEWSDYSTHIYGGILDLVFNGGRCDPVAWTPSPSNDHFVFLIQL